MTVPSLSPFSTARCACAVSDSANCAAILCIRGPAGQPFRNIGLRRRQQRRRQREQHQRAQRDAFLHQLAHRHHRVAIAVGGVDRDGRIHRHHFEGGGDVAAEIDIDDAIDAALPGERQRLRRDVLVPVVDHEIGAGQPRLLGLHRRTDGGDHARAAPFRQLHGVVADRAGAAGDQHGLAQRSVRRESGSTTRSSRECRAWRRAANDNRSGSGVTRCSASVMYSAAVPKARPLRWPLNSQTRWPISSRVDAIADLIDDPGAVAVRDHARKLHRADSCRRGGRHRPD